MTAVGRFRNQVWLSQITLFAGLGVCCFLLPHVITSEGGASNFGNHWSTVGFYTFAFGGNMLFAWLAAREVSPLDRHVAWALRGVVLLTLTVYLTTFPRRYGYDWSQLHDGLGIVLYAYDLVFGIWIAVLRRSPGVNLALAIQVAGSVIGLLSAMAVVHLMFVGQSVGEAGFSLVAGLGLPGVVAARAGQAPVPV